MIGGIASRRFIALVLGLAACGREPAEAQAQADAKPEAAAKPEPAAGVDAKAGPKPAGAAPVPTPAPTPTETLQGTAVGEIAGAPAVDVVGTTPAPAPTGPTIFVVGEGGVLELGLDGTVIRTLSKTPGRSPRWLPGKRELVFLGTREGASRELRAITVADGKERRIAGLPLSPPCSKQTYAGEDMEVPVLDLQNESELSVTPKGDVVCMTASDHPADLRNVDLSLAIRLADGHVEAALVMGGDECKRASEERPEACEVDYDAGEEAEEIESPFPNTYVHSRSPDGRWLLVHLRSALGDVLHIQLVLHDTRTKKSYPLPLETGEWPKPMKVPKTGAGEDEQMIEGLPEIGGEDAIVWVGDHHLVLRRTLFVAGEKRVTLPGDVAW